MSARHAYDQSIGFLLADVSRLLRRDFDRRVRSLELTQVQWRAIAHLAREEGIKQAVLAEQLDVKPITLARLIDRMQAAGWVRREADPVDRRASLVFLTEKVQPILDELKAHAEEVLEDVMSGISVSTQKEFVTALMRMKQNLTVAEHAAGPQSNSRTKKDDGSGQERKHRRAR